jgi:glycine/D-amino acid oxidase-like deaminating enzyme
MSEPTNPTLAELDAAVEAYREELCVESAADYLLQYGGVMREKMTPMAQRNYDADVAGHRALVDALIAAAEARGAARERDCVLKRVDEDDGSWGWDTGCDWYLAGGINPDSPIMAPKYCKHCGGRVRVEGA